MSGIRLGDIPDMNEIQELGLELLEQSVYEGVKPDIPKFRTTVAGLMGSNKGIVLLVVDDQGSPQGFLLGIIDSLFWSQSRYATDIAVYVREGFRHLAPRLFQEFIEWAKSKPRVAHITLGLSSGIGEPDRVGRMYERFGLNRVGGIYYSRV